MAQQQQSIRHDCHAASDDMIYLITHDLRAPIRALTLLPDWIEEDFQESGESIPSIIGMHLDTIREQTELLDQMILHLRDYSRIGRLSDPARCVSLHDLIMDAVAELPKTPSLTLDLQLDASEVFGPANDLKMLFNNLLSNCLQHHDGQHACVTISSSFTDTSLQIDVIDDGPGIDAKHRERAFELMTTLYRRDDGAGTGIGLAIARRVVTHLNGTIQFVDNTGGRGARARILLPKPTGASDIP